MSVYKISVKTCIVKNKNYKYTDYWSNPFFSSISKTNLKEKGNPLPILIILLGNLNIIHVRLSSVNS